MNDNDNFEIIKIKKNKKNQNKKIKKITKTKRILKCQREYKIILIIII